MRRSDREITDMTLIEKFISAEKILRVGFSDNGEVYIVPVNYGYKQNNGKYTFYFHGAKAGRKYELTTASPLVGFEIDGGYYLQEADTACGHSAKYQSVIGTGRLSLIDNNEEKREAFERIMFQATGKTGWDYPDKAIDATAVYRLEADKISCKAK